MKSLLIFSSKRKSGKAALVCSLADVASSYREEKAAIIDTNPRQNASYWAEIYEEHMDRKLVVEQGYISCVPRYLEEIAESRVPPDLILIDTVLPFGVGLSKKVDLAVEAARKVDLVLILCHPTPFDVWGIEFLIRATSKANTPALVVLNTGLNRNSQQKEVENNLAKLLKSYPNAKKEPYKLKNHEDFIRLLAQGKDLQKSSNSSKIEAMTREIVNLYQRIEQTINQREIVP